jgi:hypothetical protein
MSFWLNVWFGRTCLERSFGQFSSDCVWLGWNSNLKFLWNCQGPEGDTSATSEQSNMTHKIYSKIVTINPTQSAASQIRHTINDSNNIRFCRAALNFAQNKLNACGAIKWNPTESHTRTTTGGWLRFGLKLYLIEMRSYWPNMMMFVNLSMRCEHYTKTHTRDPIGEMSSFPTQSKWLGGDCVFFLLRGGAN